MNSKPEQLYLDLMKKTLSFTIWPEPPVPLLSFNSSRRPLKRFLVAAISKLLNLGELQLVHEPKYTEQQRRDGHIWPGYAHTMVGLKRLDNLQHCVETVIKDNVPGDLIETGVWRGGSCIFMKAVLSAYGESNRKIFVADSFEGLPKPDEKYAADKGDKHHIHSFLAVSKEQVQENFRKYGLLDDKVEFLKGWFKDTLPTAPIKQLAIMRLDGDMYASTIDALENLYPKLSPGGFCIIDDYALPCCKSAVSDFRAKYQITEEIKEIDWSGVYWRKA